MVDSGEPTLERISPLDIFPASLSEYGLYEGPAANLTPASGVIEYQLNTPLFSDYSSKQRLIKLPDGTAATYTSSGPLDFPVGTVIAKTFYYPEDLSDSGSTRDLIETRILELTGDGWVGVSYVWNEEHTDAEISIAGETTTVSWTHQDGELRDTNYVVPNLNDCKRCHTPDLTMQPIGPRAYNLNREIETESGGENQLVQWSNSGILKGMPGVDEIPTLAVWDDESFTLNERARAYLDVNCAHCHNPEGPARSSGLHLNVEETEPYHLGTFKTPVAAGQGTGGRLYGIVPGKPDESILEHRMRTTKPGEIMPEFGKSLVHEEGLELIRQWIMAMEED